VIDAINRDLPFDRFTIEQVAGDLLPDASPMQKLETAFHRQTLTNTEGGVDREEFRVEATFDRTETTGAVWMALTMTCARCHSHKYDRISQREYYQLFAFFNNANETKVEVPRSEQAMERYREAKAAWEAGGSAPSQAEKKTPQPPLMEVRVMAAAERTTRVLHRGDFLQPGDKVTPGALAVIHQVHPLESRHADRPPDRLDLARWLVHPDHPLTPRVTVNHVWAHLFGRGLVPTLNDFGVRGDVPTHPELLDWLAWHFPREMEWSRKALIKTIVTSATFRQASHHRPKLRNSDPTNRLLARQNRIRVEATVMAIHAAVVGSSHGRARDRRAATPSIPLNTIRTHPSAAAAAMAVARAPNRSSNRPPKGSRSPLAMVPTR
jgi:hypothetical protein